MTYVLAVVAAVAYGLNWVLQQHEAAKAPTLLQLHPVRLIEHLIRHRLWLVGLLALAVGSLVQEFALASGSLPVVESLLVLGLVFALFLSGRLFRQSVTPRQWVGAFLVCAGLAGFLLVGQPTPGHGPGDEGRWILVIVVLGVATALLCMAAWRLPGPPRAAATASAAAVMFGLSDALSKAALNAHGSQIHLLISWQLYALVASAVVGVVLSQIAYNAAPLAVALPYLAVVEPIAGLAAGILALKVHFAATTGALAIEAVAAAGVVIGSMAMGHQWHPRPAPAVGESD